MFAFLLLMAGFVAQTPAQQTQPSAAKPAVKPAPAGTAKTATTKAAPAKPTAAATPALETDDQKTIYTLGVTIYRSLAPFDFSPEELRIVERGLMDAAAGKPAVDVNTWGPKIQALGQARNARVAERQKAASKTYIEKAATEPGAVKTDSGLVYQEITPGTGASPKPTDTVKVNYRGTLVDGTEFDSSYKRNAPAQFGLSNVIRCWTEGLQKMKVGGKARLVCPSDLAYGEQGRPSIPGGAALVFEIELLDIVGGPPEPGK